jgi:hypothetical protein
MDERARRDEIARAISFLDALGRDAFSALYREQVRARASALGAWARAGRNGPRPTEKLLEVFGKRLLDTMLAEGALSRSEFPPCDKALSSVAEGRELEPGGLAWDREGPVALAGGRSWLLAGPGLISPARPPGRTDGKAEAGGATWRAEGNWVVGRDSDGKETGSILLGRPARFVAAARDGTRIAALTDGGILHVVAVDQGGDPYAAATGTCREVARAIFWRGLPGPLPW